MTAEGYSAWVQLPDTSVVVGPSVGTLYGQADGFVVDGYGSTDAPVGVFEWERSFQADKYPQEELAAIQQAWRGARRGAYPDSYYWNKIGPYNVDLPWATGAPLPSFPGDTQLLRNRNSDNQANNGLTWAFYASTSIGGHGSLRCEVHGASMSLYHSDLLTAAGPLGDCQPSSPSPTAALTALFAGAADGRSWEVQYEHAAPQILQVDVRPDKFVYGPGESGEHPMEATYFFTPTFMHDQVGWGAGYDLATGWTFTEGTNESESDLGGPKAWTLLEGVVPVGKYTEVAASTRDDHWTTIDMEAALAAEADNGRRGYGFMVLPDDWLSPSPPITVLDGLDATAESYGYSPVLQFRLAVRPTRVRAHYLSNDTTDPVDPPDDPDPITATHMGIPRQSFLRGRV